MSDITGGLIDKINELRKRIDKLERLEHTMSNNYGYVSSAWQKDPILLGYSDVVRRAWQNTNLSSGTNAVDDSAVPTGEIWIITNLEVRYAGTVSGVQIRPAIVNDSTAYVLDELNTLSSGVAYGIQGYWVLKAGENLRMAVYGATAGDDVYCAATGHKVDIDL